MYEYEIPHKWTWENFFWSWESNFIPFNTKFKCIKRCAKALERQTSSTFEFLLEFLLADFLTYFLGGRRDAIESQCESGKVGSKKNFFSECLDGVQLPIQKCPDGLQFSAKNQVCVPGYML